MKLIMLSSLVSLSLASTPSRLLVASPPSTTPSCATYHGQVGATHPSHLFYLPSDCSSSYFQTLSSAPFSWTDGQLVWVSDTALDASIAELVNRRDEAAFQSAVQEQQQQQLSFSAASASASASDPRTVLELPAGQGRLVQFSSDTQLASWTEDPSKSFTELVAINPSPLPLTSSSPATGASLYPPVIPVPSLDVARIAAHLEKLKFDSLISTLVSTLPRKTFERDVKYLSGEVQPAKEGQGWESRHSLSEGGRRASNWIIGEFRDAGLSCEQHEYRNGFAPLVECVINGTDSDAGTFVLGAHFDSRGSFGYTTAPGADDDASGTSLLLSIGRHIASHDLTFRSKVVIAAFSGEEQGLLGSNWYANQLKARGEDVVLMIQADMIGYRKPGEVRQIAFPPDHLGLQEARFLVGNISTLYAPELVPGITPACCSDHQSFGSLGFASTWVFERNGPIADPFYHNSGDLAERPGYDFEQIYLTTTVVLATLLEVAGFAFRVV